MSKNFIFLMMAIIQFCYSDELFAMKRRSDDSRQKVKKKLFSCPDCNEGPFVSKKMLNEHFCEGNLSSSDENDDQLECVEFDQIKQLRSKAISGKWNCNEADCDGKSYATKGKYEAHLLQEHSICPICKFSIPDASKSQDKLKQLAEHIVHDCGKNVVYVCNQNSKKSEKCTFITLLKDRAQKHAQGHFKKSGVSIDLEEYAIRSKKDENTSDSVICPVESCGKKITKLRFKNHILTQHKLCPWCKDLQEYQSFEEIEVHYQKNHQKKNLYACQKCKSFLSLDKTKFLGHQTVCNGPKVIKLKLQVSKKVSATKGKFKCCVQDCDQAYADKGRKDQHIVSQHHMCPECGFKAEKADYKGLEKVAIHLLTATKHNNAEHTSEYARRSVYICDQVKKDGTDCCYMALRADEAQRHAQTHSKSLNAKPYEISEDIQIEAEILVCPFTQSCERAQSGNPFSRRAKLIEHIVRSHVECPFGESFGCCQKWNEVKWQVAQEFGCAQTSDEELKPKLRLALEKHVLECHKGSCKYIKACARCENTISTAEADFKIHSCSAKNRSKSAKHREEAIVEIAKNRKNIEKKKIATSPKEDEAQGVVLARRRSAPKSRRCSIELPSWCWVLNCGKEFQGIEALKDHLIHDHAVCMECFEKYAVATRMDAHKKSSAHKIECNRVLELQGKPSEDSFLFGEQEVCVMCAMSYCFQDNNLLKNHKKNGHKNKKNHVEDELNFDDQSSDSSEYCQDGDFIDFEREHNFKNNDNECASSDEELRDWKCETPEFGQDITLRVVHTDTNLDESYMDLSDSESSIHDDFYFSCWMQNDDIVPEKYESVKAWRARPCCAFFSDYFAAVEHLKDKHNICFECMQKKAFFPSAEKLIAHENRLHKGEVARASKCPTYGEKAVCLLCVIKKCKYQTPKKLELHVTQKH